MSRSAVRVRSSALCFTCKKHKNRNSPMFASGVYQQYVSSTSAVDFPRASSLALALYKWLQGTAGGVSDSSGIDRLTDVPGFQRVRHRRKSFARVPRSRVLRSCAGPLTLVADASQRVKKSCGQENKSAPMISQETAP